MADTTRALPPRDRWAHRQTDSSGAAAVPKPAITLDRILDAAFALIRSDGYEALTMRRLASALGTGAASLYAHVRNKADLDDLLIGELCAQIRLPSPDPSAWREGFVDVCHQLLTQYRRYPGVSRAVLTMAPQSLDTLRISEGLLAILLAGPNAVRDAAWTIDAALLRARGLIERTARAGPGAPPRDGPAAGHAAPRTVSAHPRACVRTHLGRGRCPLRLHP
jgi:AcrR family transcriptional regulator